MRLFYVLAIICFFVVGCAKFITRGNQTQISSHGERESHYNGDNCMNCHYQGGAGEGWFTLAGTLHGNTNAAAIEVYDDFLLSNLVKRIEVDGLGNFYTTEAIDYTSDGLVVGVRDNAGNFEIMGDNLYHGQCNLCHGTVIVDRIEL